MKKILIALSGGVDSSVAALLMREQGYDVAAAYIKVWMNETDVFGRCPAQKDIDDGRAVCRQLGIDYEVVNLVREYREAVVDYLVAGYRNGVTPNPDALCNREMKFGVFLKWAIARGFDGIATGHYVRRVSGADPDHPVEIHEGLDKNKDQSYFLALLNPGQVQHAWFPLGDIRKPRVREIAREWNLPNAEKRDSQGICFLGEVKINDFLAGFIEDQPGPIINHLGKLVGKHRGLHRYTLGQRKGIGVPSNTDNQAYVVVNKDFDSNALHVAFDSDSAPGLFQQSMEVTNLSFTGAPLTGTRELLVKPRYRDPSTPASFVPLETDPTGRVVRARLEFEEPQRALAPGQVAALYDGERLLGGGFYR